MKSDQESPVPLEKPIAPKLEDLRDLGFGTRASLKEGQRLLNHDGRFNAGPIGQTFAAALDMYHALLTVSWWRFYIMLSTGFVLINALFASLFSLLGAEAFRGLTGTTIAEQWWQAFFFSIHTFATVGYGDVTPVTLPAHWLVTLDVFIGLISTALSTGLLFARFARPTTKILYSNTAVVAPYRDITGFEFRITNLRRSQLIEVQVQVAMVSIRKINGKRTRIYNGLPLERNRIAFFPLHWTVVHPIDAESPLFEMTQQDLDMLEVEFIILITAIDDTFSQTVHSRNSYSFDEITWGASFVDPFVIDSDGIIRVDLREFHKTISTEANTTSAKTTEAKEQ